MDSIAARIKELIDSEDLSNSEFAKRLEINPAIISHILGGRNKVSLQVIEKIKTSFTNVNLDYLLIGNGQLYSDITNVKESIENAAPLVSSSAFPMEGVREVSIPGTPPPAAPKDQIPEEITKDEDPVPTSKSELPSPSTSRKPVKVLILYEDNSFEIYQP